MDSKKFSIEVDPRADKDIKKLQHVNTTLTNRVVKLIDSLASDPFSGKPLKANKQGCYSLRTGDYRIIYEVYISQKVVHIIRIGHRKEIYR